MNKVLFFFLLSLNLYAADLSDAHKGKINLISKNTPTEYKIVIASINTYSLSKEEKENLLKEILLSDAYFSLIPKTELFILCKTEIYKQTLSFYSRNNVNQKTITPEFLRELSSSIMEKEKQLSPLARWIARAIIRDLRVILGHKYYQTYLIQKSQKKKLSNIELVKIDKKIKLLSPWINTFNHKSSEQININLKPLHFTIVKKLAFLAKVIFNTSSFEKIPLPSTLSTLKMFTYSRELTKSEGEVKKIEDVLSRLTLFPKKSQDYHAPTDLPEPKNDWIPQDDMEKLERDKLDLFPNVESGYTSPTELPKPVDDWILDL
ncbi:hypothetical protein A9Q84_05870 [Halobacteriovorax marinus]|uniref:Uncharacterized protein n=1 Tax=Halobacteriovorax marinus TaxID=97084 RepID=A0A1Y5FBQ1_9BACT|nr:hypothetical protein A9Q84_05870 [Halobacteriovorax marinus]